LRGRGETGRFRSFDLLAARRDGNKSEIGHGKESISRNDEHQTCPPMQDIVSEDFMPIGSLVHGLVHAVTSGTMVTIWLQ
jgi:hypothetical protein